MADEKITIAELGAYTNNSPNKEGIKKVVKAINDGLSPDLSDYQKKLTAGDNITITEENVISCTTPPLTAGNGIIINENTISIAGWRQYTKDKNWGVFKDATTHVVSEDLLILAASHSYYPTAVIYIPKGMDCRMSIQTGETQTGMVSKSFIYADSVLGNGDYFNNGYLELTISDRKGSGANEYVTVNNSNGQFSFCKRLIDGSTNLGFARLYLREDSETFNEVDNND